MKYKNKIRRLDSRRRDFEESGKPGGKSRVSHAGHDMHRPGSLKK